ncbi:hypothetical protein BOX15_Mlig022973g1 [Macrostomum lignano]|uniref:Uncharacterized protein n=1 Tax=Macrostomum lignano TaxID=282301 RepID=A0A267EK15_9PLAT|nr:hypothetical protein BOX15_Mlig022973g3 [Macrostomum lignano]PAA72713.1 hypothetical protein BOX15_Mlig022973g1 [Macrostomum lignano]
MAKKTGRDTEPYTGFVEDPQLEFYGPPKSLFYTTSSGMQCKRYYCSTCGPLHRVQQCSSQRTMEYMNGTTLPDALWKSRQAYRIDEAVQQSRPQGNQ